jgi:hypothetical protein
MGIGSLRATWNDSNPERAIGLEFCEAIKERVEGQMQLVQLDIQLWILGSSAAGSRFLLMHSSKRRCRS